MQRLERRADALTPWKAQTGRGSHTRAWPARSAAIAVLAAASVLLTLVYWPGLLTGDTPGELNEAATGHYTDWHAPILDALWRLLYLLGVQGPGWLLPVDLYANICEQCDNYVAAPKFRPALEAQLADIHKLRDDAQARGWDSETARHERVIASIDSHLLRLKIKPDETTSP
jgi:hypothetical protein